MRLSRLKSRSLPPWSSPEPGIPPEAGEGDPSHDDYSAYLDALGSERALHLKTVLGSFGTPPSPSLRHPDLVVLMEAEEALERLSAFRRANSVPQVLGGQADLLFRRLLEFGEFLLSLDHKIVYVGEIGVGKTTAACRQAGLVTDPANPSDLKAMMLDTGGGRHLATSSSRLVTGSS